jgi:hypothetical protein
MKRLISARWFVDPPINLLFAPRTFRKSILLLLALSMMATLVACGSSKSSTTPYSPPEGNYVFSLAGSGTSSVENGAVLPVYYVAGVFTVAGGVITAGEQDFTDAVTNHFDQINPTGSTISKTSDGNVQIVLTTCAGISCVSADPAVGVKGVETLDGAFLPLNSNKAFITEFDDTFTASGTLELQSSAAAGLTPSGGYAFNLNGTDKDDNPVALGGIINVNLPGIISGGTATGSIFDANNNGSGTAFQGETFSPSTVSAPDSFGRVTFTLNPTDSQDFPKIILAAYNVDANHIRMVETSGDQYQGTLGGIALSQGTNTGLFSSASVSGNSYVVGLTGFEHPAPLQVAGVFSLNSDTSVTGFINHNDLTPGGTLTPTAFTATAPAYTVDSTGRVTVTIPTPDLHLQLYLDGNGHALAITLNPTDTSAGLGFQQSGSSFSTTSFNGASVVDATGWDLNKIGEIDAVGPITTSGSAGTFSGTVDLNWLNSTGPTYPDLSVSGTLSTANGAAANGVFTGTIAGLDVTTKSNSDVFSFYLIDSTGDFIAIETDANQLTLGYFNQQ